MAWCPFHVLPPSQLGPRVHKPHGGDSVDGPSTQSHPNGNATTREPRKLHNQQGRVLNGNIIIDAWYEL